MKDEIVSIETAKLAKQKGFDWLCSNCYKNTDSKLYNSTTRYSAGHPTGTTFLSAPTQSLLQKWLREKKNIAVAVYTNTTGYNPCVCKAFKDATCGTDLWFEPFCGNNDGGSFDTYEEALEFGLQKALSL